MSMIGNLARISETTRQKLHQNPDTIRSFLYPDIPNTAAKPVGFLGRLFGKKQSVQPPPLQISERLPETDLMDLDKSWHGLHFLFTGQDWEGEFPEGFLLTCGEPIGEVDVGYGPARSYTPQQVEQIAAFLDHTDESTLRQRLDPKRMRELDIYPSRPAEEIDIEEEWEYLSENFRVMKKFIRETATNKMALVVYLN